MATNEFMQSMEPVTVRAWDLAVTRVVEQRELLTCKEAMEYLRVSRSTLYRLMWKGHLPGHKVGSAWRFYQTDVQACIVETRATGGSGQHTPWSKDQGLASTR